MVYKKWWGIVSAGLYVAAVIFLLAKSQVPALVCFILASIFLVTGRTLEEKKKKESEKEKENES